MWNNRDKYTALSILPYDDHTYRQTPFEDIEKQEYERLSEVLHGINLSYVKEEQDMTSLQDQVACAGNACEVVL